MAEKGIIFQTSDTFKETESSGAEYMLDPIEAKIILDRLHLDSFVLVLPAGNAIEMDHAQS
jgi:hypothetical protein